MKKLTGIFIVIVTITLLISCKPSKEEAMKYHDALVNEEVLIIEAESAFTDAVVNNKQSELDVLYAAFLKQIETSNEVVNNIKALGDDSKFKDATLALLSVYSSVAKQEYSEVLKIAKIPDTEYTEEHNNKMKEISAKIDDKLNKEVQNFLKAQKELATKYKITATPTTKNNINY
ncbi:MAG: hypothetical protein AUJ97_02370 [Bacteroidetes bacterium CG2_30_32_10]|nr:MAG: hypothetical protein AUJ97_02370 [Bacteroidetes bacterium CG2_30_32_10]